MHFIILLKVYNYERNISICLKHSSIFLCTSLLSESLEVLHRKYKVINIENNIEYRKLIFINSHNFAKALTVLVSDTKVSFIYFIYKQSVKF